MSSTGTASEGEEREKAPRGGRRAGSGRRPRNTRQVTLRLSPETIGALHELALVAGLSISEVAERKLRESLRIKKTTNFESKE